MVIYYWQDPRYQWHSVSTLTNVSNIGGGLVPALFWLFFFFEDKEGTTNLGYMGTIPPSIMWLLLLGRTPIVVPGL